MLSERRADELKRKSKDELIALILDAERQRDVAQGQLEALSQRLNTPIAELVDVADVELERDRLRVVCKAAADHIIDWYVRNLWNEHYSYDLDKAREVAEERPPRIVRQLRAALGEKSNAE